MDAGLIYFLLIGGAFTVSIVVNRVINYFKK